MRIKKMLSLLGAALAVCALTSCQLAKESLAEGKSQDRLVGVFITSESLDLFDMERYLNENLQGFSGGEISLEGDASQYNGRLYATRATQEGTEAESVTKDTWQEFAFTSPQGFYFFVSELTAEDGERYTISNKSDGITDSRFGIHYKDDEDRFTLEGTLCIAPSQASRTHYINPVYQAADGSVYATTGQGLSVVGDQAQGGMFTQTFDETIVVTEDKKSKKKTTHITTSIKTVVPPQKIVLLEMSADHAILSQQQYIPGALPEDLTPRPDCAYLLLEAYQKSPDGTETIARTIFSNDKEGLESHYADESNVVFTQYTTIHWPSNPERES